MSILSRLDDFVTSLKTFSRSLTSRSSTAWRNQGKERRSKGEVKQINPLSKSKKKQRQKEDDSQFVKDERLFEELMLLRMIS